MPDENLSLAHDRGIAEEALIRAGRRFPWQLDLQSGDMFDEHTHERGHVARRVEETRQQRNWFQRNDRSAIHPRASTKLGPTSEHDRAALHFQTSEISDRTAD